MKREQIDARYKWDLSDIYANDEQWEKDFGLLEYDVRAVEKYRGRLSERDALLECLRMIDRMSGVLDKLCCYARMHRDEDGLQARYAGMSERVDGLIARLGAATAFVSPELTALDPALIEARIADPDFADYDYDLKETVRRRAHTLTAGEEKLLAMSSNALGMFQETYQMLDYIDLPLPKIKVGDERVQLTQGLYSLYLQNRDVRVRKRAFDGMYQAYLSLINTITATYAGSVKGDNFVAKARRYRSALEQALDGDNVPAVVYDNLLAATKTALPVLHDYVAFRKQALGVDKLHMYDMYVPLVDNAEISVPYEKAYDMVLEGLAPLGEEYRALLVRARDEHWIDVMENENKRSGAYSWGAYGTHPYVLLNYTATTHDVFTIAHELGHSMHSHYSDTALPRAKAQYSIFVAEVASTVNEVLLLKSLIKKTKDVTLKKFLLSYYLDMFRTTIFRQTMFAEFERTVHHLDDKGEPLTVDNLSNAYLKLNKKYYGKAVQHDRLIRYEWARIPHFYTAFYVYKYATGMTSAVSIANAILNDAGAVARYKRFLSAGGSDSPYEILKTAGVDLATPAPYEIAMREFADTLAQLKALY